MADPRAGGPSRVEVPGAVMQSGGVVRNADAGTASAAARADRARFAQPAGWYGMALFMCAEITVFGSLMATYFYLDFDSRSWPPYGIRAPSVVLPLVAAGVLVATTVPILLAVRAARSARPGRVIAMLTLAAVVQTLYLALQVLLFRHDLNDFSPQRSAYGSVYFTLLAAHHAHVVLGILLDLAVIASVSLRGLTNYWLISVRTVGLYWYVVAGVGVLVTLTQLSPSL